MDIIEESLPLEKALEMARKLSESGESYYVGLTEDDDPYTYWFSWGFEKQQV